MSFGSFKNICIGLLSSLFVSFGCGLQKSTMPQNQTLNKPKRTNRGSPSDFTVHEIRGKVLVRNPFAVGWQQVKVGMRIPEGHLLQVGAEAAIVLKHQLTGRKNQPRGSEATLTIKQPMSLRLGPDILRQTRINKYFINTIPKMAAEHGAPSLRSTSLKFSSAWKMVQLAVTGDQLQDVHLAKSGPSDELREGLVTSAKKIVVMHPVRNATVRTLTLPMEMTIAWNKVDNPDVLYHIYQWPLGLTRPPPVAVTALDSHTLIFPTTGEYLLQITSSDGVWQSPAHTVRIVKDGTYTQKDTGDEKGAPLTLPTHEWELSAQFPPPDFTFIGKVDSTDSPLTANTSILFQVRLHSDFVAHDYHLIFANDKGQEIQRIAGKKPIIPAALVSGTYIWWMEAKVKSAAISEQEHKSQSYVARSESRKLTIVNGLDQAKRREWVKQLLSKQEGQSVYLSEGL